MNFTQHISVSISLTRGKTNIPALMQSIKRALAYVSYRCNQALQYEIILVTNDAAIIPIKDRKLYEQAFPVRIYDEPKNTNEAILFQKGASYAKYPLQVTLNDAFRIIPETLGDAILKATNGVDVVVAIAKSQEKDMSSPVDALVKVSSAFLLSVQKNPYAKALVFTKEVWDIFKKTRFLDKTYIIEFLYKSSEAGFKLAQHEVIIKDNKLHSRFTYMKESLSAGVFLFLLKLKKKNPLHTPPSEDNSMINAGVRYKKQEFITHSTLSYKDSAIDSFTIKQMLFFILCLGLMIVVMGFDILLFDQIIFAMLSVFYMVDVLFNFFIVYATIRGSSELTFTPIQLQQLSDEQLPMYTILCPLYKEAHMLGHFLDGIAKIAWPPEKLDVLLLLEEDDTESIETIGQMQMPAYVRILVVPASQPKTKPKACNYGLAFAKGEYVVIFDAEDIPDPMQLKKAYLGFQQSNRNVVCLQAKLNYHNASQNLLTRFFTAEYSWLFDIQLPGLQALNTIIPLGGTSNHFRKVDLIKLNGWDPFNVTEDADLGLRIFRLGYRTAILDSVTLEEANSNVKNWIRQRSRWIKGYMQTYLVHTRDMLPLLKARGPQALMLHLVIGGRILFIFVNPLLWIVTIAYFLAKSTVGPVLEQIISPVVLYMAIISLLFGNYLYIIGYILGCVKREQWGLIKFVYLSPFYLLLISVAGCMAFYQLLFKPHYWEKTVHGLHLKPKTNKPAFTLNVSGNVLPKLFQIHAPIRGKLAKT